MNRRAWCLLVPSLALLAAMTPPPPGYGGCCIGCCICGCCGIVTPTTGSSLSSTTGIGGRWNVGGGADALIGAAAGWTIISVLRRKL